MPSLIQDSCLALDQPYMKTAKLWARSLIWDLHLCALIHRLGSCILAQAVILGPCLSYTVSM